MLRSVKGRNMRLVICNIVDEEAYTTTPLDTTLALSNSFAVFIQ